MGRAAFMRVPVSEANDLNFLLCRCDETGNASRLGNNEIQLMKRISLNSVTENRTLIYLSQLNWMTQRTAADAGMALDLFGTKKNRAPVPMLNLGC